MKKLILLILMVCCLLPVTVYSSELEYTALYVGSNRAYVNDVEKQLDENNPDVCVFVENDRSYVPVRFISENYGGKVEWLEGSRNVIITFEDRKISLTIDKKEITVDGKTTELDVAPVIKNQRTFLPLRACVEAIGKEVFYCNGLILISDIKDILDPYWDVDIVDMMIDKYFVE